MSETMEAKAWRRKKWRAQLFSLRSLRVIRSGRACSSLTRALREARLTAGVDAIGTRRQGGNTWRWGTWGPRTAGTAGLQQVGTRRRRETEARDLEGVGTDIDHGS